MERYYTISNTMDYVIGLGEDERQRFIKTVTELGKAFALCATEPTPKNSMMKLPSLKRLKAGLVKLLQPPKKEKYVKHLQKLKQRLINLCQSVVTEDVIDVYQTLGLEQPIYQSIR